MTVTPISVVWSVLSILIAAACWFSLLQPYWFVHPDSFTSLGVYSYCLVKYDHPVSNSGHSSTDDQPLRCSPYGGQFQFSNLPSGAWQAACVLYGSGCVLMSICALLSLIVLCLDRKKDRRLALFTGYVQIVSGQRSSSVFSYTPFYRQTSPSLALSLPVSFPLSLFVCVSPSALFLCLCLSIFTYEWMYAWSDERMDLWIDRQINKWTAGRLSELMNEWTEG